MSLTLSDLINQSLDKIKKAITKKQFQLKQLIEETQQVKEYNDANHLIKVYQQCIESKQIKLIELALFDIKNIVDQGFLAGEEIIGEKRAIEVQYIWQNYSKIEQLMNIYIFYCNIQLFENEK